MVGLVASGSIAATLFSLSQQNKLEEKVNQLILDNPDYSIAFNEMYSSLRLYLAELVGELETGTVNVSVDESLQVGTTIRTARLNPPPKWRWADGTLLDRVRYSELFTAIGTSYGAGDSVSTFGLPNWNGPDETLHHIQIARAPHFLQSLPTALSWALPGYDDFDVNAQGRILDVLQASVMYSAVSANTVAVDNISNIVTSLALRPSISVVIPLPIIIDQAYAAPSNNKLHGLRLGITPLRPMSKPDQANYIIKVEA